MFLPSCTFVYVASGFVIHLLGAVENVDENTQRSAKIFGRFGLSRTGRSGRRTAHDQMQTLRKPVN